jgi:hypothetical protein
MRSERKSKAKPLLIFLAKSGIAAILLYLLLRNTRYEDFARNLRGISWWWLAAAASLHLIGYLVSAYRWRILLVAQGLQPSLWELIKSYVIATFFNYVLLGTVGGDISRAYDTGVRSRKGAEAVSAVFLERVTGVAAMMFLAALGILFLLLGPTRLSISAFWNVQAAVGTCVGMFLLLFAILFVLFHPRIVQMIAGKLDRPNPFFGKLRKIFLSLHTAISVYRSDLTPIYRNLFWALVLQVNVTVHYFFIGLAMGLPLLSHALHYFCSYMVIVPAVTLILMIPITPGGAGVREWTLRELRSGLGFDPTAASSVARSVLMGWLQLATVLLYGSIGFLMFLYRLFLARRLKRETVVTTRTANTPMP